MSDHAAVTFVTEIGSFAVIEADVVIGRGCRIGHHVVIRRGSIIGDRTRIDDHASVGKEPMRAARSAITHERDLEPARLGDEVIVGTGAVIYRGCVLGARVMVADLATVREDVSIGDLTIVGKGATVENRVRIGRCCKIETEAYIAALSVIGDGCFIAPGVTFTNDNFLGRTERRKQFFKGPVLEDGARIGANVTVLPGRTIGADALVGAGSIVTRDVPPRTIVVGAPARAVRPVPEDELLACQVWWTAEPARS